MSFFNNILKKLGLGKDDPAPTSSDTVIAAGSPQPVPAAKPMDAPPPAAMSQVDVVAKLDALAAANSQKLDWKVSIVDLLKLLGLDSSLDTRKELATELGCPADKMNDSAQMNVWLHKTVLQKLAQNGGNIPNELL